MKMVRSLLLGSAALVAGSFSAQAADLAAAEPVEYVKICDAYGAGYFFIPGSSDTCLRISGYVRSFVAYQGRNQSNSSTQIDSAATSTINPVIVNAGGVLGAAGIVANVPGVTAVGTNTSNNLNLVNYNNYGAIGNDIALQAAAGGNAAATARLNALGPNYILRANAETSDQYVSGIRALLRFDARTKTEWGVLRSFFEFAAATSNAARNGTPVQVRFGFVQFGPITAGVTESFFNTTATNLFLSAFGDQTRRVPTLAYTASLGNGVSVTLAADDSSIAFAALPIGSTTTGLLINAGNWQRRAVQLPDGVANIRVAQSWGTAQISGAVGQFRFANTACTATFALGATCTANKVGWAIATGVQINLPAIAKGDTFVVRASYSEGALHYLGNVTTQSYFGNSNASGTVTARTGFAVLGEFNHFFTPAIRSSIVGSYTRLGRNPGGANFGASTVNLREAWQIAGQLFWTPVRGFDVGVELFYQDLSFNAFGGGAALGNRVIGSVNDAGWGGFFRVQRSF